MELKIEKMTGSFFSCAYLGIVAEEAFFRYQIGISYFIFIAVFYTYFSVGFDRFRSRINGLDI